VDLTKRLAAGVDLTKRTYLRMLFHCFYLTMYLN